MIDLDDRLRQQRERGFYRERLVVTSPQDVTVRAGDELLLSFCSNDYLGLANDARVVEAMRNAGGHYGVGAGASHLVSGHSFPHHALEEELADFVGSERALLFSTGYMANLGVCGALLDRHATLFEDKLNHASLIDAARLSRARIKRYPHVDMAKLEQLLSAAGGDKLIATDAVFSMDGDVAPLPDLINMVERHDAWLLADDAHGLGVLGPGGRGSFEQHALERGDRVVLMGTLGKAFGVFGAFVAGSSLLIENLIQHARTYIYTTALPPPLAEAARASLRLVRGESWRREQLRERVRRFRRGASQLGLKLPAHETPIQPVILGSPERALAASRQLRAQGILVTAIRPPTVPPGTARLRITFSAGHTPEHVDRLLDALSRLAPGS